MLSTICSRRHGAPARSHAFRRRLAPTTLTAVMLAAVLALLATGGCAGASAARDELAALDLDRLDRGVAPADDLERFANGGWEQSASVPPELAAWGPFEALRERNAQVLRAILEEAAADADAPEGSARRKLGDFWCSCMDTAGVEAAGLEPLRRELELIDGIADRRGLRDVLAHLHSLGIDAAFCFRAEPGARDATVMAGRVEQGGLGLRDPALYLRDDGPARALREAYREHVAAMLALSGDERGAAQVGAGAVLALETRLAAASMDRAALRDVDLVHNPRTVDEAEALMPGFSWNGYFHLLELDDIDRFDMGQPEFFRALDALLDELPLDAWKVYLRASLLRDMAEALPAALADEHWRFHEGWLRGVERQPPRWRRCVEAAGRALPDELGAAFAERALPAGEAARARQLVESLRAALAVRIERSDWLGAVGRQRAAGKLRELRVGVGAPDDVRDHAALRIDRGALAANVLRARAFATSRALARIGRPTERDAWPVPAFAVAPAYDARRNALVVPAGLLQPPFAAPAEGATEPIDDAVRYGSLGALVAHHLARAFDDVGVRFDAAGHMRTWWSDDDLAAFGRRTSALTAQLEQVAARDALPDDPASTPASRGRDDAARDARVVLGCALDDLAGLAIAHDAFTRAVAAGPADMAAAPGASEPPDRDRPSRDGLAASQRFFLAWAQTWRHLTRPGAPLGERAGAGCPPARWRVLLPCSNLEAFHRAFDVRPGDGMWRAPEDRVEIW